MKITDNLFGLVVGYVLSICLGAVDFSGIHDVGVVALPKILPFKPEFNLGAIISLTAIFLVSATETIGDTSALASSALDRNPESYPSERNGITNYALFWASAGCDLHVICNKFAV